jgi:phosphate/sulfate permease
MKPIDPRGPRFNQSVLTIALVLGFVFQWWYVAPIFAIVLFVGAAWGSQYGPFLRLYAQVIKSRLAPPKELEDPRPPRFAAAVGVVFLSAATIAFVAGASVVGWALALIVAVLAGLSATSGICVGCEVYLWIARRRGVQLVA